MEIAINASCQRLWDLPIEVKIIASFWLGENPLYTEMGDFVAPETEVLSVESPIVSVLISGEEDSEGQDSGSLYTLSLLNWEGKGIVKVDLINEHGDWEFVIFNR